MKVCLFNTWIFQLGGGERMKECLAKALGMKVFTFRKDVPLEGCEEIGDRITRYFKSISKT